MELDYELSKGRWAYGLMWILSVGLFAAVVWLPALLRVFPAWSGASLPPAVDSILQQADRWVIGPQVRVLLFLAPPLEARWPLAGGLTDVHLGMLAAAYVLIGWICARIIFYLYDWWSVRLAWLVVVWIITLACLEGFALLLTHFGVLASP